MEDAWWGPTVPLVGAPWFALSERNSPGSIIVNMSGKRFMNESMPYVEACHHMYGGEYGQGPGPGENIPAWLVFDQQYRDRYIFAGLQPGQRIPTQVVGVRRDRPGRHARGAGRQGRPSGRRIRRDRRAVQRLRPRRASTRTSTAAKAPTTGTTATRPTSPIPTSARSANAPYYAAKMVPGDLGTKGGIRTDVHGRALRDDGSDHRRPLRRGQRQRPGDGPHLSRSGRHHRARDDVRVPGRAAHRGSAGRA